MFDGDDGNLVSIGTDPASPNYGRVAHGYLSPELIRSGYLKDPAA